MLCCCLLSYSIALFSLFLSFSLLFVPFMIFGYLKIINFDAWKSVANMQQLHSICSSLWIICSMLALYLHCTYFILVLSIYRLFRYTSEQTKKIHQIELYFGIFVQIYQIRNGFASISQSINTVSVSNTNWNHSKKKLERYSYVQC